MPPALPALLPRMVLFVIVGDLVSQQIAPPPPAQFPTSALLAIMTGDVL